MSTTRSAASAHEAVARGCPGRPRRRRSAASSSSSSTSRAGDVVVAQHLDQPLAGPVALGDQHDRRPSLTQRADVVDGRDRVAAIGVGGARRRGRGVSTVLVMSTSSCDELAGLGADRSPRPRARRASGSSPNGLRLHQAVPARARACGRRRASGTPRPRGRSVPVRRRPPRPTRPAGTPGWSRPGRGRASGPAPGRRRAPSSRAGSRSTSSSMSSTRTGASDSIPSTAWPSASLSSISRSSGCCADSSRALARTSSVSSSSRHGGAHSAGAWSSDRWSATAKDRISSTVSPQNSTRTGCSSVGGKTSTMPPRTANSPRRSTRSTRW